MGSKRQLWQLFMQEQLSVLHPSSPQLVQNQYGMHFKSAGRQCTQDSRLRCWQIKVQFSSHQIGTMLAVPTRSSFDIQEQSLTIHCKTLGTGERYHGPLRRIFKKVSDEYSSVSADLRLALSVKAMNDCTGPEGIVLSLLVFGVMPRLPDFPPQEPSQLERF